MSERGKRTAGGDRPVSQRIQIRLYSDDLTRIGALIADGYAENRSEVVRCSVGETEKWRRLVQTGMQS